MQTHTTTRRRNRVFKSLHKPLTYLGVERTLFYFVCVGAVAAFNLFNSLIAGLAVFIGGYAFGHWVTNSDPAFLRILAALLGFEDEAIALVQVDIVRC
jgi:type IV secretory pathway TrbD component